MKNILILGSEGFIGRHLVSYFSGRGFAVSGCDLFETSMSGRYAYHKVSRLSPEWETVFTESRPEICINAAGSGNVPFSVQHPLLDFEANTLDTIRLLDTIRRLQPQCKYLHISSAAVYGNPPTLPVVEGMPLHPLSPYGWHKLMSEAICREYAELYGVSVAIVRPFSVYGDGLRKQLLWDVCRKMQEEGTVTLYGTGRESRDFIHIRDLCGLLGLIVDKSTFQADIYNAGNGVQVYIDAIVELLRHHFGYNRPILFGGQVRKGDPLNWEADISRAKELGYRQQVSLEAGIKEYISFFKQVAG